MEPARIAQPLTEAPSKALIRLCADLLPGLELVEGTPDTAWLRVGGDNGDLIQTLVSALQHQHPEAGRHYWSARSWGLLTWQPVLLVLAATEILQCRANLSCLGQKPQGHFVMGMMLGEGVLCPEVPSRAQAGAHLRDACDQLLAELNPVIRMNPVLARRLLADRILATLLRMRPLLAERSHAAIYRLAQEWLEAAGLEGASALTAFELPQGGSDLALDRKGCCQHYRLDGAELCKTCPRQPVSIRIKRLQEEWSPDAGAE